MKSNNKVYIIFITLILLFIACQMDISPPITSPKPPDNPTPTPAAVLNLEDEMDASIVIGQPDFESYYANQGQENPGANTISSTYSRVSIIEGKLYIPDSLNHRILIFDEIPALNNASANSVLGQKSFTSREGGTSENKFYGPQAVSSNGTKFCICEYGNNRVIIYNYIPQSGDDNADVVVGQLDFVSYTHGLAPNRLNLPEDAILVGEKLVIADTGNNRVLIYTNIPSDNNASADIVLGQDSFEINTANYPDNVPTARNLNSPRGLWSDGNILIVSDHINNRVLIWDPFPKSNFEQASIVIGQPDFSSNNPGSLPNQLSRPYYIDVYCQNQLFVADLNNNRILVWNTIPESNGKSADVYLGCKSEKPPPQKALYSPTGVCSFGNQVFVSDYWNRVVVFNSN